VAFPFKRSVITVPFGYITGNVDGQRARRGIVVEGNYKLAGSVIAPKSVTAIRIIDQQAVADIACAESRICLAQADELLINIAQGQVFTAPRIGAAESDRFHQSRQLRRRNRS